MELYSGNNDYKLYYGNMLDLLEVIDKETIDSIITDPPYELNFMSKNWDNSGIAFQKETWQKCYEVLKPGGYLLAFGGSRTFHRIACAIEDAGFEIRDTIMWLYGSGFPKSMSLGKVIEGKQVLGSANVRDIKKLDGEKEIVGGGWNSNEVEQGKRNQEYEQIKTHVNYTTELGKKWNGWGTALKPSYEPIIIARKPFKGSLVDNVIEYGVGGINIDECRVETNDVLKECISSGSVGLGEMIKGHKYIPNEIGRFPANTIMTYNVDDYKEVCSGFKTKDEEYNARYFYCAKASKKDRDEGLDTFEEEKVNDGRNTHPTVKPTELMQYLVRLVSPDGATILDCFNGSGSTGKAVMYENRERNKNYKYIGIELTEEYLPIAKARIEYVCNLPIEKDNQLTIFDFIKE